MSKALFQNLLIIAFLALSASAGKSKTSSEPRQANTYADSQGKCKNSALVMKLISKAAANLDAKLHNGFYINTCQETQDMKKHKVAYDLVLTNGNVTCKVRMFSQLRNLDMRKPTTDTEEEFAHAINACNSAAEKFDNEDNGNRIQDQVSEESHGLQASTLSADQVQAVDSAPKSQDHFRIQFTQMYTELVKRDLLQGKILYQQNFVPKFTEGNGFISGGLVQMDNLTCELYMFYLPIRSSIVAINNPPSIVYKGAPKGAQHLFEMPTNMKLEHPNCADVLGTDRLTAQLHKEL